LKFEDVLPEDVEPLLFILVRWIDAPVFLWLGQNRTSNPWKHEVVPAASPSSRYTLLQRSGGRGCLVYWPRSQKFACIPPFLSCPSGPGHGKGTKRTSHISHRRSQYSRWTYLKLLHSTVDLRRGGGDIVVYRTGTEEPPPPSFLCPTTHSLFYTGDYPKIALWSWTE